MPRPITSDDHYEDEQTRSKPRNNTKRDAAGRQPRNGVRATGNKGIWVGLIVVGITAGAACIGLVVVSFLFADRPPVETDTVNVRSVTDPSMQVKADDLESAYRLRKEDASSRYDGKSYLIHFPSLAAMDEDSEGTPCVTHWGDKGFKCPALVVRLKNKTGYTKTELVTKSIYVEGKIVGLKEATTLPWMKKWSSLAPSHMVPNGFVIVVENGAIVTPPK